MLNGLNERFENIINVIQHREPFPSFEIARSMLEREESRLKKSHQPKSSATHSDHASSSTALMATSSQTNPVNQPPRFTNNRGNRRNNGNHFRGCHNFQQCPPFPGWGKNSFWPSPVQHWQYQFGPWNAYPYNNGPRGILGSRPSAPSFPSANIADQTVQPTTDFAEAFNTMTLADPTAANWFMDTGATSHLASSPQFCS